MGFSRQEYWSELACPPPRDLPTQRLNPCLLRLLHCRQFLYWRAMGDTPYGFYIPSLNNFHLGSTFITPTGIWFSSVQFSSVSQSCPILWDPMNCSTPGFPVHHQLLEFTQTHVHRFSDAIQPSHSLSSPSPPASNPSQHQSLFQWVNSSHDVAKYWSFSFSIIPSKEHPGLISFRMDWLDLLAIQGTLKSLIQHHSSKASVLRCSAFFTVQLSHPYMTTWKTIALTRRTFVGKVMSLLLNMLSRLVITFNYHQKNALVNWTVIFFSKEKLKDTFIYNL